jgi:hypothetical protein
MGKLFLALPEKLVRSPERSAYSAEAVISSASELWIINCFKD